MRIKQTLAIDCYSIFYRNTTNSLSLCSEGVVKFFDVLPTKIRIIFSDKRIHSKNCHRVRFSKYEVEVDDIVVGALHSRLRLFLEDHEVDPVFCDGFSKTYYFVMTAVV